MAGVLLTGLFVLSGLLAARVLIDGFAGFRFAAARLRAEMARATMSRDFYVRITRIDVEPMRRRGEGPALGVVRMACRRRTPPKQPALPVAA